MLEDQNAEYQINEIQKTNKQKQRKQVLIHDCSHVAKGNISGIPTQALHPATNRLTRTQMRYMIKLEKSDIMKPLFLLWEIYKYHSEKNVLSPQ